MRTTRLRSAVACLFIAGLAACDGDSSEPAGPAGPGSSEVTLESTELMSGGTGVLVSDGFAGLDLEPAVDDNGLILPGRWSNLRVTVGGIETDARRLDDRSMEFSVPTMPGGTYGVDVSSPFAHGSISARVLGVIASARVVPCFVDDVVALVPVGNALVFDTDCRTAGGQHQGVGVTWPAVPGRGFEWFPDGEVPDLSPSVLAGPSHRPNHFVARRSGSSTSPEFWVWEAGPNPRPVESLDCFGTADVFDADVAPAETGDGTCLLISPFSSVILRDGEPLAEWPGRTPGFIAGHFVASDDGWMTARGGAPLLVLFDPTGDFVVADDEFGRVRDARFAPGGGPLYVATEDPNATFESPPKAMLLVLDRATGNVLRETTLTGTVTAIAVSENRLWIARTTEPTFGGELFVELLDPETLELRRSIAVARDLSTDLGFLWPFHGQTPVLLEDATGTRLTYTGVPQDHAGVWSHTIEVK
jgi:hypothetical protein